MFQFTDACITGIEQIDNELEILRAGSTNKLKIFRY